MLHKPEDVRMRSGRKWFLYVCIFHYIRDRDGLKYIIFCLCAPGIVLRFILNFCCGVHFPLFSWAYTLIRSRREQLCLLKCKFPLGAAGPDCGTQRVKRVCVCVCEETKCMCVCGEPIFQLGLLSGLARCDSTKIDVRFLFINA